MSSNLYVNEGSQTTIKGSGGSYTINMANGTSGLANGNGVYSDRIDLGARPAPGVYRWALNTKLTGVPTVGSTVDLYYAGWESINGTLTADAPNFVTGATALAFASALSSTNALKNLKYIGSAVVDNAGATVIQRTGLVYFPFRYISLVVWNSSGVALDTAVANHFLSLTPVVDQAQ